MLGASIKNVVDVRLIIGVAILTWSFVDGISQELPCHFLDSINITDGIKHNDSSITYNDVNFNKDQYAEIDYILVKGKEHNLTKPYLRGCVCSIKPCIRSVCPIGSFYDDEAEDICKKDEAAKQVEIDIIDPNNVTNRVLLKSQFAVVGDRPCELVYRAENYSIMDNGYIMHEDKLKSHHTYIMLIEKNKTNNTDLANQTMEQSVIKILICFGDKQDQTWANIPTYAMLTSVPFIIATMLVYICVPKLQNLLGKCLLCYLLNLVIGYICLARVKWNRNYVEKMSCTIFAHLIYFSFLSAFVWLTVISYDIWRKMRDIKQGMGDNKRIFIYVLFALGLPLSMTLVVFTLDKTKLFRDDLLPDMAHSTCFLQKEQWPQFLYFFLPLCITSICNIVFFVLTSFGLRKNLKPSRKALNKRKDTFKMYLSLFIIMGVTWSMEAVTFIVYPNESFLPGDICNALQGVLIFILFVIKPYTLRLIRERWYECLGKPITDPVRTQSHTDSTATHLQMKPVTSTLH